MRIVQEDMLTCDADVIVNAANTHLQHGGGLARAIADAAAPHWDGTEPSPDALEEEWIEFYNRCENYNAWNKEQYEHPLIATGNAGLTSAGALPFKAIIHAVGPIWGGGNFYEQDLLWSAYDSAYAVAAEKNLKRIAVPAISCGIFGFPAELAAPLALGATEYAEHVDGCEVTFYIPDDDLYEVFIQAQQNTATLQQH